MELTEIFTEHKITSFERTTITGWNHTRPAIGLYDKDGYAVAQISDSCLYYLNDGEYLTDEDGNEIYDIEESDAKNIYEMHSAMAFADNKELADELNEWLMDVECVIDVYYRKNGKDIEDTYEYFYRELLKMLKSELKEACDEVEEIERQKNIVDAFNQYKPFERYKEDYTWSEFKSEFDLPSSWTIAAFKKEAKRATIKLIGRT